MSEIPQIKQILEGAILAADKPLGIDNLIQLFEEGLQFEWNNMSLEDIERKLTECCQDHQPVLIYGQKLSSDEHEDLINRVRDMYADEHVKNKEYYNWKYIDFFLHMSFCLPI